MQEILSRVARLLGARVLSHRTVQGGYTPALRLVCETSKGSFFVKAGVTPLTAEFLRREIAVYSQQSSAFMPQLLAAEPDVDIPLLLLEDLSANRWPPPWDEHRVGLVLEQIHAIHATPTTLERFTDVHGPWESHWQRVADDPLPFLSLGFADSGWLDRALPMLLVAEAQLSMEGEALCHLDIRSDNLCLSESKAIFFDWNWAARANHLLDLGFWLPSLAYEGGPTPETILPDAPEVAATVCGYFAAQAGLPNIPDAPFVRRVQREQLTIALPWAARALGLPPPR